MNSRGSRRLLLHISGKRNPAREKQKPERYADYNTNNSEFTTNKYTHLPPYMESTIRPKAMDWRERREMFN